MKPVDLSIKARPTVAHADVEPKANPLPEKRSRQFSNKAPAAVAPTDLPFKRGLWAALDLIAARVEQNQDELQNLPLLEPKSPAGVDAYHPLHDFSARRRIDRNVGWIQQWLAEHADDREAAPEGLKRTMEETLFMIPSANFTPVQTKKLKDWLTEKAAGLVARSPWWRSERRERLETWTNRLTERAGEVVTTEQRIECLWRRYSLMKSIGSTARDLSLNLYSLYEIAEKSVGRDPSFHLSTSDRRALLVKVIEEQRDLLRRLGGRNRGLEDALFLSTRLLEKTPAEETKVPATVSKNASWKPIDAAMAQVESGNIPEARRLLQEILDRPSVPGDAADQGVRDIARSILVQETQVRIDRTMAIVGALSESRFSGERWSAGRDVVSRVLRHVREYLRSLPPEKLPRSFEETLKSFAAKNPTYRQDYESFTHMLNDMGGTHSLSDYSRPVPEEKGPVWALVHAMDHVEESGGVKNALAALESILDKDTSYMRGQGDLEGALLSGAEMLKGYTSDRSLQRDISKFQGKVPSYESWGRLFRQTVSARTVFEIAFCLATGVVAGAAGRAASVAMRARLVTQVAGRGVQAARVLEGLELGTFTSQTAFVRAGMAVADVSANGTVFSLTGQAKDLVVDGHVQNPLTAARNSIMDVGLLKFTMAKLNFMHWAPRALLAGGSVMQAGKAIRGDKVTFQDAFRDIAFALGNDFAGHHASSKAPEAAASHPSKDFHAPISQETSPTTPARQAPEFNVVDGELWTRGTEGGAGVVINGKTYPAGEWVSVAEGDTVMIDGRPHARILGEMRPVTPARDDAPVLAHGENGVILDNGDGTLTKVGGSVLRNAQLDVEQQALALIQYAGLDIAPPLVGRPHANELIIGRLEGRSLDRLSAEERRRIPAEAWEGLEEALRQLQKLGIHHNDISAGNIISDGRRLRLLDFGLAKLGVNSTDDATRLRDVRTASAEGREGQALSPLASLSDRKTDRVPVSEIPFAPPSLRPEPVIDRMKNILGVTDDTYVYRASNPQWIQDGHIGLNKNSVALVHDPYNRPELLKDIQTAYSDAGAPEILFDSMWENGTKASALENPGLNVSTDEAEILSRYGGGPGSDRVLVRIRLGDIPNARIYPDVGGGRGNKAIFYVTGEGSSVPVEVYDHATRSWVKPDTLDRSGERVRRVARAVLETNEDVHARIEQMIEQSLHGQENESLHAKLRSRLRAEFSQIIRNEAGVERLEDVVASYRSHIVSAFEHRATSIASEVTAGSPH